MSLIHRTEPSLPLTVFLMDNCFYFTRPPAQRTGNCLATSTQLCVAAFVFQYKKRNDCFRGKMDYFFVIHSTYAYSCKWVYHTAYSTHNLFLRQKRHTVFLITEQCKP